MNRAFLDLLTQFPPMRDAFDRLPEWDKKALCDGLRDCVVSPNEEETLIVARLVGIPTTEETNGL